MYDSNGNFYKPERGSNPFPDHIMLAFCGDAKSEMSVIWRTSTDVENGHILYRKDGGEWLKKDAVFETKETDIDISNYYSVRLSGLEAGTKYVYTVGSDKFRSEEYSFETEPESLDKFSFIRRNAAFGARKYSCSRRSLLLHGR